MTPKFKLRLEYPQLVLGPGKAELLAHIAETGSISAAGRAMGMSYKRAWSLVEEMNAAACAPVVLSERGGRGGGGAALSEVGAAILQHYRAALERAVAASAEEIAAISALLRPIDMSERK